MFTSKIPGASNDGSSLQNSVNAIWFSSYRQKYDSPVLLQ